MINKTMTLTAKERLLLIIQRKAKERATKKYIKKITDDSSEESNYAEISNEDEEPKLILKDLM